tara:strand:- start:199 stop:396 length:198 start_codon:yes stop_codon:yes gene_type:complete
MLRDIFSDPVSAITFVIMWVFIIPAVQRWWNNRNNSQDGIKSADNTTVPVNKNKYPRAKKHKRNY